MPSRHSQEEKPDLAAAVGIHAEVLSRLPRDPAAISALEGLLEDPAACVEAARALASAHRLSGDSQKLLHSLEVIAGASGPSGDRVAALIEAAQVHLSLTQPDFAFAALARALRLAPGDGSLLRSARDLAEKADSLDTFEEVLDQILDEAPSPARPPIHRLLAELKEKAGDAAAALENLSAALDLEPGAIDLLRGLQRLHRAREEWASLAVVTERLAGRLPEPSARRAAWREAAALYEQRLDDKESALDCWHQVAEGAPADREAAVALERLATELGRPEQLSFALERQRAQEGSSSRGLDLAVRLAVLKGERLGDLPGAIALCQSVLEREPEHAAAKDALAEMLAERVERAPREERAELLRRLACLRESMGEGAMAFAARVRACSDRPEDPSLWGELQRSAEAQGSFEELAAALEDALERGVEPGLALELWKRLGPLYLEKLDRPDLAARAFGEVLRQAPGNLEALRALSQALQKSGPADRLVQALLQQSAEEPAAEAQLNLLFQAAQLAEEKLGDRELAVSCYHEVLQRSPEDRAALKSLEKLLAEGRRFEDLARVLERQIALARERGAEEEALELTARLSRLRHSQLSDSQGALSLIEEALQIRAGHGPMVQALEELARAGGTVGERAMRLIEPIIEAQGGAGRLGELLEARLVSAASAEERTPLLKRIAALRQAEGDPELAFLAATRALRAAPGDGELLSLCVSLGEAAGAGEELCALLEELSTGSESPLLLRELARRQLSRPEQLRRTLLRLAELEPRKEAQLDLYYEVAQLSEEALQEPALAAEAYREVLSRHPEDRTALRSLRRLLEAGGRREELAEVLEKEILLARRSGSAQEAAELLLCLGRLRLELGDPRAALDAFRAVLEQTLPPSGEGPLVLSGPLDGAVAGLELLASQPEPPLGAEAATLVEPLLERAGERSRLVKVLESHALGVGPAERAVLLMRVASLTAALGDGTGAFLRAAQGLREAPEDSQGLERAVELAERAESLEELCVLLEELAPKVSSGPAQARMYRALARAQEKSGEEEAAVESLRAAFALERDRELLAALDRLLGKAGRHLEQAEALGKLAELGDSDQERAELSTRRGEVLARGGAEEAAVEALGKALALAPGHPRAVAALETLLSLPSARERAALLLEPVYRSAQDRKRLVEVLEVQLLSAQGAERRRLLEESARAREAIGELKQAFAARAAAFVEGPQDPATCSELERLAEASLSHRELADQYRAFLSRGCPGHLALELWRKLAYLYRDKLEQPELAAQAFEEVVQGGGSDREVLGALAQLYREANEWPRLARVMELAAEREADREAQAAAFFSLAQLADERLAEPDTTLRYCREVLLRGFPHPGAEELLASVLFEEGRFDELASYWEDRLARSPADALEIKLRLAGLEARQRGGAERALSLVEEVLAHRPLERRTQGILEDLMRGQGPARARAAALLEPAYLAPGREAQLAQTLEARLSGPLQEGDRLDLLQRLVRLYSGPLEQPAQAYLAAAAALRVHPDWELGLDACVALCQEAGAEAELAELLGELAPRVEQIRPSWAAARARLLEALGRRGDAIECWKSVLAFRPGDPEALEHAARLLERESRFAELLEVLRRKLELAGDEQIRSELMLRTGVLLEDALHDAPGALQAFRQLLAMQPGHPQALFRLDRLCEAQGHWRELEGVLRRRLEAALPAELEALKLRLADLCEARLSKRQAAVELYGELLGKDPSHPVARARLEDLAAADPTGPAAEVLLRAYRITSSTDRLAALLDLSARWARDGAERKRLHRELAEARTVQGEPELAFLALLRAFREDPLDGPLRDELERLAEAAGSQDALAEALVSALPEVKDDQIAAELCLRLATLYEGVLADPDQAASFYQRARTLDASAGKNALPGLSRLYQAQQRWEELAGVLEDLSLAEGVERVALSLRLGRLCQERLADPERAASAYHRVLHADPTNLEAIRALERLYQSLGQPERLFEVLSRQRELLLGPEREAATLKMARVAGELGELEKAISLCREALAGAVRSEAAFSELARWLEQAGRHRELKELLEGRLVRTLDPREVGRLHLELGRVAWRLFGQPADAVTHFRAALDREPRNETALSSLAELLEALARSSELAEVLRRLIPLQQGPARRMARIRLAELAVTSGRREEALEAGRQALDEAPSAEELERLRRVFDSLQAFPDAARALELRAEGELSREDRPAAARTLLELARLKLRSPSPLSAGAHLEKVLELDPSSREAYEKAEELYSRLGLWAPYVGVVRRFLPHLAAEERLSASRRLAAALSDRLGDPPAAFAAMADAFRASPLEESLAEETESLAIRAKQEAELASLIGEVADSLPRGEGVVELYLRLAALLDQRLDDAPSARAALEKILEFDPLNETALDRLMALHARRGQFRDYLAVLGQKREIARGSAERKSLLREAARIQEEKLGDPEAASSSLRWAIELEPDSDSLRALVDLSRRQKKWAEAAGALLSLRDLAASSAEKARVHAEIGDLYAKEAGDDQAALASYRAALELDPQSSPLLLALEAAYQKLDRPAELLEVLGRRLERASKPEEQIGLLFRSAQLWEDRLSSPLKADECIEAVLAIAPNNLEAIGALERLRREQGRFEQLLAAQERHLQAITDREAQSELLVEMGAVLRQELREPERALSHYQRALELSPRNVQAIRALAELFERRGDWPRVLEMIQREAQLLGETSQAADLQVRAGKLCLGKLSDPARARQAFLTARKACPAHLEAIRALRDLCEKRQDWEGYETALKDEREHASATEEKARALLALGRHYQERKPDPERARRCYQQALDLVPDLPEAAAPLSDLAWAAADWPQAARALEVITQRLSGETMGRSARERLGKELQRLGQAYSRSGEPEKAIATLERAVAAEPSAAAREELGNLLLGAGRQKEALEVYEALLAKARAEDSGMSRVGLLCRVGELHATLDQLDQAQQRFEKALSIAPSHQHALRGLSHLHERAGRFRQAAEAKQKLALTLEGEARFRVCVELGQLATEKLKDNLLAIDAYTKALKVKPDALEILEAIHLTYLEARQLSKAVRALESMAAHPALAQEPSRKRKILLTLGRLAGEELGEVDRAVTAWSAVLEMDPRFAEAFSALERLLRKHRRFAQLDEAYQRMIGRLVGEEMRDRRAELWRDLGELRAGELGNLELALEAFAQAVREAPQDAELNEKLGRLSIRIPGKEEAALSALRLALRGKEPAGVVPALMELFARRKEYDSAYLAAKLSEGFFGQAGAAEDEILRKLSPLAQRREVVRSALSESLWHGVLIHPSLRGPLGEMMAVLFECAGKQHAVSHSEYKVNPKKHRVDLEAIADQPALRQLRYLTRVLGLPRMEVYSPYLTAMAQPPGRRSGETPDAALVAELMQTEPPSLKLGGRFASADPKDRLALISFTVALARPELGWSRRAGRAELELLVSGALTLVTDRLTFSADERAVKRARRQLEKSLSGSGMAALATVARKYAQLARPDDLDTYLEGAELTAARAALFVSADPLAVKRTLIEGRGLFVRVGQKKLVRELLLFALGGELAELRAALEMSVEAELPAKSGRS